MTTTNDPDTVEDNYVPTSVATPEEIGLSTLSHRQYVALIRAVTEVQEQNRKLDAKIDKVADTLTNILGTIEGAASQLMPIVDELLNHPMAKMFGLKGKN